MLICSINKILTISIILVIMLKHSAYPIIPSNIDLGDNNNDITFSNTTTLAILENLQTFLKKNFDNNNLFSLHYQKAVKAFLFEDNGQSSIPKDTFNRSYPVLLRTECIDSNSFGNDNYLKK